MDKVELGKTGVFSSVLALGSDVLGSKIDRARTFELLDYFADRGGTLIDTANFYSSWIPGNKGGESETVIGEWMKERGNRNQLLISSKLGFDYPDSQGGLTAKEIEQECDKSLRRLQTDHLDIYYAHRDDFATPMEETMAAFDRLVKAGKVRVLGASNMSVWRIAEANAVAAANHWNGYQVVQQWYTYVRPRHGADFGPQYFISEDLKAFAKFHGITLFAYSVLLRGAYTRPERQLPAQFPGVDSEERIKALKSVAEELDASPNQVVIAWMRQSSPAVYPVIAGSITAQLEENIGSLSLKLSDEHMNRLSTAGNPVILKAWVQPL